MANRKRTKETNNDPQLTSLKTKDKQGQCSDSVGSSCFNVGILYVIQLSDRV